MPIAAADFGFISGWLHRYAGMVVEPGKEYLVETRLLPLALREGCTSLDALMTKLRTATPQSTLHKKVLEAMVIHETSFFRDWAPFQALKTKIVPDLLKLRAAERTLTIWCGAASSGQEPYSVALLLKDSFGPQLAGWKVRIVATDLSSAILEKARSGRYTQPEMNRGMPAPMLVKYFKREGAEWKVNDDVRALIDFRELNLTAPFETTLPPADLVLLRNVLIYFDLETRRRIFRSLRKVLRADGTLLLGSAETTVHVDETFEPTWIDKAVCFRPRRS